MTYNQWAALYPEAAAALVAVIAPAYEVPDSRSADSEAQNQQRLRLDLAQRGVLTWRNNVGATPAKCKFCGAKQQPVRYGLANDSAKLNEKIKSADLICGIPRLIRPEHVGLTLLQFGSIEVKESGWEFTGKGREAGQAAWAALIEKHGGYARFSTGEIEL